MNRRSFLSALAALLAAPKVLLVALSEPVRAWRLYFGKRIEWRASEVLRTSPTNRWDDGLVVAQADGPIQKGDPVVLTPEGKVRSARWRMGYYRPDGGEVVGPWHEGHPRDFFPYDPHHLLTPPSETRHLSTDSKSARAKEKP